MKNNTENSQKEQRCQGETARRIWKINEKGNKGIIHNSGQN